MDVVTEGCLIRVDFELRFADGTFVDSNEGLYPVEAYVGDGILLEAVENALLGKKVGDKVKVIVPPEDGYGFADPNQIMDIPLSDLPEDARSVGSAITAHDDDGELKVVIVTEMSDGVAKVDFNHPYAGRTLHYDITVRDIAAPKK